MQDRSLIPSDVVYELDPSSGHILSSWGADTFSMPHGLTIDWSGTFWITDVGLHQVLAFDRGGTLVATRGEKFTPGSDPEHFCKPTDVAVLPDGTPFVADGYCNSRLVVLPPETAAAASGHSVARPASAQAQQSSSGGGGGQQGQRGGGGEQHSDDAGGTGGSSASTHGNGGDSDGDAWQGGGGAGQGGGGPGTSTGGARASNRDNASRSGNGGANAAQPARAGGGGNDENDAGGQSTGSNRSGGGGGGIGRGQNSRGGNSNGAGGNGNGAGGNSGGAGGNSNGAGGNSGARGGDATTGEQSGGRQLLQDSEALIVPLSSSTTVMHSVAVSGCMRQAVIADREAGSVHVVNIDSLDSSGAGGVYTDSLREMRIALGPVRLCCSASQEGSLIAAWPGCGASQGSGVRWQRAVGSRAFKATEPGGSFFGRAKLGTSERRGRARSSGELERVPIDVTSKCRATTERGKTACATRMPCPQPYMYHQATKRASQLSVCVSQQGHDRGLPE